MSDATSDASTSAISPLTWVLGGACVLAVAGVAWWALSSGDVPPEAAADRRSPTHSRAAAPGPDATIGGGADAYAGVPATDPVSADPDPTTPPTTRRRVAARAPAPDPPPAPTAITATTADVLEPALPAAPPLTQAELAQRVDDVEMLYRGAKDIDLGALSETEAIAELEGLVADADVAMAELLATPADDPEVEVRGLIALGRMYDRLELLTAEQIALSDRDEVTQRLSATHGQRASRMFEMAVLSADQTGVVVPGLDDARAMVARQNEASAENTP